MNYARRTNRWENIRVEGTQILADAVFDMKDPRAAQVTGKVQDDFMRMASIGAWVLENMQVSRKKGGESKTFPIEQIEDKLEKSVIVT